MRELPVHPSVLGYYNEGGEQGRLSGRPTDRLEFERTKQVLAELLPPAAKVLDIGGGPGAYAAWLARRGHHVELFDLMPLHVRQARDEHGGLFTAEVADARHIPRPEACADVVLLMGPLYHLEHEPDRLAALREARRLLRPGGLLVATAIGRLAWFLDALRGNLILDESVRASVRASVATGVTSQTPGPTSFYGYLHRPAELRDEVTRAGFTVTELIALQGLAHSLGDLEARLDDEPSRQALLAMLKDMQSDPGSLEVTGHLLAVATYGG